uniref:CDGSH iron-sulfur domain-containing protein 2 n=1 Tax=Equus asinus TaxID=9793 RepID=A0A8C4L4X4_EQUAS
VGMKKTIDFFCIFGICHYFSVKWSLTSRVQAEWIPAVTIAVGTAAIGYPAYKRFYVKNHCNKSMANLHIRQDNPRIAHAFHIEDLGNKAVYCHYNMGLQIIQKKETKMDSLDAVNQLVMMLPDCLIRITTTFV